jgi:hypothetical protein
MGYFQFFNIKLNYHILTKYTKTTKILKQTEFLLVMLYSGILLLIGSTYNVAFIDFFFIYAEI